MNFVYSTATTPVAFTKYSEARPGVVPTVLKRVVIQGGANLPKKTLVTPRGVATAVSDEDLAFLVTNPQFAKMQARGFMSLGTDPNAADRAAANMTPKDGCAPKVASDFAKAPKAVAAAA